MTSAFDDRIVNLGIELEGGLTTFSGLYISAKGTRFGGDLQNECEVIVYNLTTEQRNYLLTQTSPFARPRTSKLMTLDVGRESYGTFRLYQGNVIACTPTQPPDIGIILRGLEGAFWLGSVMAINYPAPSKLSTISQAVATNTNNTLNFQATDKNINNFSYTGAAQNQVTKLGQAGGVDAYVDNGMLTVKNQGKPLPGSPFLVNANSGMVGIPEVDEQGVSVKVMLNPALQLGGQITIQSDLNPPANGTYTVYKMDFEVSNRETPFWYNIFAQKMSLIPPQYQSLP